MPELRDIEVTIVALVGKAANKRKFLIVKNEKGNRMSQPTPRTPALVLKQSDASPVKPDEDGKCPTGMELKDGMCHPKAVKKDDALSVEPKPEVAKVEKNVALDGLITEVRKTRSHAQWAAASVQIGKSQKTGGKLVLQAKVGRFSRKV